MAKTSSEVATEALRHLVVIGLEENAQPSELERARTHMSAILTELDAIHGMAVQWTIETVPDTHFRGLSIALAGSLSAGFSLPEMSGEYDRGIALLRDIEFQHIDKTPAKAEYF